MKSGLPNRLNKKLDQKLKKSLKKFRTYRIKIKSKDGEYNLRKEFILDKVSKENSPDKIRDESNNNKEKKEEIAENSKSAIDVLVSLKERLKVITSKYSKKDSS